MGKITSARAYANNEVAVIAWTVDEPIDGCLGFDVVRIRIDGTEDPKGLATWVPFEGQRNPTWTPQDTGVWPVQKLFWRDLTLRKHRSDAGIRDSDFKVKYSVRAVGDLKAGMPPVPVRQPKAYDGPARRLGYIGAAVETNEVMVTADIDGDRFTFTNGILSGQWLKHAIEAEGKDFNMQTVKDEITDRTSKIRAYLTGDALATVSLFLSDGQFSGGKIKLALYELSDPELKDLLVANKDRIEIILSNTSKERGGTAWDATNKKFRAELKQKGVKVHDRMFNNNHIGHNKFAVWYKNGAPQAVMSGSTNWTPTGLCGQSNNAFIVNDPELARAYDAYWTRLLNDKFPNPNPLSKAGTKLQVQGAAIREEDAKPTPLSSTTRTKHQVWFSPNTTAVKKGTDVPPDLAFLFDLMSKAEQAIFFLAFLPSRAGADSIIAAAVDAGKKRKDLIVAGAISDVTAMPGYVAPDKKGKTKAAQAGNKPYTYDTGHTHIVRATALGKDDIVGDFEAELLKVGQAVVHDKIVVVDPLSPNCVVAAGSHNLGFKASYENDENLVIFRGNPALAQAYAVHVLDVYDHYRFRAWQAQEKDAGRPIFEGNIFVTDAWLRNMLKGKKGDIAAYLGK
ncbi:MAG TPA: phospholipase D-like domain-containing protein [Candidatus Cybelea sp.]|nr:phospholipase D-like domain-containing protein [Candidatus Cybelea sp.]